MTCMLGCPFWRSLRHQLSFRARSLAWTRGRPTRRLGWMVGLDEMGCDIAGDPPCSAPRRGAVGGLLDGGRLHDLVPTFRTCVVRAVVLGAGFLVFPAVRAVDLSGWGS